jgi:hypothetical protein
MSSVAVYRPRNGAYHQVYLLSRGSLVDITRLKRPPSPPGTARAPDLSPLVSHRERTVVGDGEEGHGDGGVAKTSNRLTGLCNSPIRALSAPIRKPGRPFTRQVRDAVLLGRLTRRAV